MKVFIFAIATITLVSAIPLDSGLSGTPLGYQTNYRKPFYEESEIQKPKDLYLEREEEIQSVSRPVSRTWDAIRNWFQPVVSWFQKDLPNKTPSDVTDGIHDIGKSVKTFVDNNAAAQKAKEAFESFGQWIKDTHNTLKDKTFKDLFYQTKDAAKKIDQDVGGWIEKNT